MFTLYWKSTRNVFQNLKTIFNLDQEVEDLIQRKRTIFNNAFDTKADLELLCGKFNRRFS
jgi:hypothetical protein